MDASFRTVIDGELVELPCTIAAIRAGMTPDQAAAFDREIDHVPAPELPVTLVHWALAGTAADDEDEALFDRLACGEDIGARTVTARPEVA
ncbi:hypothetical protein ACIGJO_29915 [Streptomyces sp. NPDC079020]|uniref:hypothetical protein n=1 Tax=Streptomyces sp. NPDC079020 TaxID=3365722 RepID=UPI0037D3D520